MAISRPKYPTALISGIVGEVTPRNRFVDNKRTDEVERFDANIETDGGGQLEVRFPVQRDGSTEAPMPHERIAVIAEIRETREWGAHLRYARRVTPNDIDLLMSMLPASASK